MEVAVCYPVSVALPSHDDVPAGDGPHLPGVVVAHGGQNLLAWMQGNAAEKRVTTNKFSCQWI